MKSYALYRFSFILLTLVLISVLAYHRYTVHKRYEIVSRFDYLPKDSIDYSYFDQNLLHTYIDNCSKLSIIAKTVWIKEGVDILSAKSGKGEIQSKINQYQSLLRYTKIIETKLSESKELKDQGLSNDVIEMVVDKGMTIGAVENERDKATGYEFLKGKNVSVHSSQNEIWELQKLLNANDYNIAINGVFDLYTDSALLDFQKNNNLYPSHTCDDMTLKKLSE